MSCKAVSLRPGRPLKDGGPFLVEMGWAITSSGDVALATQVRSPHPGHTGHATWRLCDVAAHLLLTLDLAGAYWNRIGYWSNAQLSANLNVGELELLSTIPPVGGPEIYRSQCVICGNGLALDISSVSFTSAPAPSAVASTDLTAGTLEADSANVVTSLTNQLLRSMGHFGFLPSLKASVDSLLQALKTE
jgi:hypothetical protein